jgi:Zn-dependent protease
MDSSFRLGRIAGIEVGIHSTWLLAVGFITWSLAGSIFPADYPRWSQQIYWTVAVIATLLLFLCVLLHELSHCVVARARESPCSSLAGYPTSGGMRRGPATSSGWRSSAR